MAVIPTGAIYKSLIFDGEDSRNYGVYITGEAVFNAPERDVEMVSIPGRNGSFALDKGRFQNIEVSYPAGIFAETEADFAQAISDFRNLLCSRSGYVRLTDDYNPNEYRMAIYKSGLEVEPAQLKAGEFNIVFDCKPQRWLTSGETKQTKASGSTITNPTLFPASPLLECKGHGDIYIGGVPITVMSVPIGDVLLSNGASFSKSNITEYSALAEEARITIDASKLNTGDNILIKESVVTYNITVEPIVTLSSVSTEDPTGENWATKCAVSSPTTAYFRTTIPAQSFKKGTASTKTYACWFNWAAESGSITSSNHITMQLKYDGANTITLSVTERDPGVAFATYSLSGNIGQVNGYSTIIVDNTFYIDLEIGEAYFISNNVYSSANYAVQIPPKLPTLRSGASIITYSNTITNFKITPRWWKI